MTIFAGILYDEQENEGFSRHCDELKAQIESDCKQELTYQYQSSNAFIAAVDAGIFQADAHIEDNVSTTLVVGDPIIIDTDKRSRSNDTKLLHDDFNKERVEVLQSATGVFCGLHYNKLNNRLQLFTDKLAVRPVYFYKKQNIVVFSTVFKYLLNLSLIDKKENFQGLCESMAFKFCLADRTSLQYVKRIQPAEIIDVNNEIVSCSRYWQWESIGVSNENYEETVEKAYRAFVDAVNIRLDDESNAIAFLSGGMDSRCITSQVKEKVENLYTFNFSVNMSQDKVYAKLYSEKLQSKHHEVVFKDLSFPNWSALIQGAWSDVSHEISDLPKRPGMIWSGDGGSVSAGHVYLNREMTQFAQNNQPALAVKSFMKFNSSTVPAKIFLSTYSDGLNDMLLRSVEKEVSKIDCDDKGRNLYYFLMFNDQCRHLDTHFETIGDHKIELMLPFFDSRFLEVIVSLPIDKCLYHEFYADWFDKFPAAVKAVPWQTYPNHKSCPVTLSDQQSGTLSYQWENRKKSKKIKRIKDHQVVMRLIRQHNFPKKYLSRGKIILAMLLHRYGIRDYSYMPDALNDFMKNYPPEMG